GRVPSMYYADRHNCLEVIDANRYNGTITEINDDDTIRVGYICRGSGGVKAESELLLYFSYQQTPDDKLDRECLTIENGNLSKDEHAYVLFRAMRGAKEDPLTGGEFISKHISPTGITDLHPMVSEDGLDMAIGKLELKVDPELKR
ncbi:hypothetical protein MKW92_029556, partial [Papaver armeniacum]